ncbi:MAG: 50S ribosomal protein L6, partial [Acidobacteriales bacterium]|nr:50S ribosomal protein L6 [Terriglobales bacterium]
MSRIGKKPIEVPKGVKFTFGTGKAVVEGPKGKVDVLVPEGIKFEQQDNHLVASRPDDSKAAVHGLARALMQNAVTGVTTGWSKDLDIVGIGYRAEMKGKNTLVFTLGYSHPIEVPLPAGISAAVDPKATRVTV